MTLGKERGAPLPSIVTISHANDAQDEGKTALHLAAYCADTEVIGILLEHNAVLNLQDKSGRTPLYYACEGASAENAQYLLEALRDQPGEEINKTSKSGRTPLRKAAAQGNVKIVKILLEKIDPAAAINAKDLRLGQTSLHTAAFNCRRDVVEVLLEGGGDLQSLDKNGRTPLDLSGQGWAQSNAANAEATVVFLVDKDQQSAAMNCKLLCTAAVKGSVRVIDRLLAAGADPNWKDEHGWTALLLAQQHGQTKAVEALSRSTLIIKTRPTAWINTVATISVSISDDGQEVSGNKSCELLKQPNLRRTWRV